MKTRIDIINFLIEKNGYKSYLEIGVQHGISFFAVNCESKVGVDPDPESAATLKITSDAYFSRYNQMFDIIFVDGLHHADQAFKDVENAMKCLNEGGTIVMHDCNPASFIMQYVPRSVKEWTGDVWKAFVRLRMKYVCTYHMKVIDTDYGVGVINKKRGMTRSRFKIKGELKYADLKENRENWLNLITPEQFIKTYK